MDMLILTLVITAGVILRDLLTKRILNDNYRLGFAVLLVVLAILIQRTTGVPGFLR